MSVFLSLTLIMYLRKQIFLMFYLNYLNSTWAGIRSTFLDVLTCCQPVSFPNQQTEATCACPCQGGSTSLWWPEAFEGPEQQREEDLSLGGGHGAVWPSPHLLGSSEQADALGGGRRAAFSAPA